MKIDEQSGRIYVRQSWLGDAMLCQERGRRMMVSPEFRTTNDSAAMGTAVHAGIEAVLTGKVGLTDAQHVSVNKLNELKDEGIRVTNTDPVAWEGLVRSMTNAWVSEIYPRVPHGGVSELKFSYDSGARVGDYELWFEGTMDYSHPDGLWDWKTAARKYSLLEKQTQSIQASVYAGYAIQQGWSNTDNIVEFTFGVMIRNLKGETQLVRINRSSSHVMWVTEQAKSLVGTALALRDQGGSWNRPWLKNDQHFLCSDRWCPWWSVCKGVFIQDTDNQLPKLGE
ncbi:MAG: exonuclease [Podoviridae sp. ctDWo9]|nr:MAG: exonuclease [Podoviridae sp. ctDWo9]